MDQREALTFLLRVGRLKPEQDRLLIEELIRKASQNAVSNEHAMIGKCAVALTGAYTISQKTADTFTKEGDRIIGVASVPRTNER
jgi:hypothetical protein